MNPVSKTQHRGGCLLGTTRSLATLSVVPSLSCERTLTGRNFAVDTVRDF